MKIARRCRRLISDSSLNLFCGLAILVFVGGATSELSAQTITNGSFEELTSGAYVNGPADFMEATAAEGLSSISGTVDWYFAPGTTLWDTNWDTYFQHGAASKTVSAPVGGSLASALMVSGPDREGLRQTVAGFTVGQTYSLVLNHTNGFFNPNQPSEVGGWEVFLDDQSILQATSTNSTVGATFPFTTEWTENSVSFAATSTDHTLTFLAFAETEPTGQNAAFQWLDNVSVSEVSVPEPSSIGVLLLTMGMCLSCRKRFLRQ